MRSELIYKAILEPDPVFVQHMLRMPDPKPEDEERIIQALPKLHAFFIAKREAFKNKNFKEFEQILDQEIAFVKDFDSLAYSY